MKVTVEQVRKWLEQFPSDAQVYAYQGEVDAIVVVEAEPGQKGYREQLGELLAEE